MKRAPSAGVKSFCISQRAIMSREVSKAQTFFGGVGTMSSTVMARVGSGHFGIDLLEEDLRAANRSRQKTA